MPRVESLIEGEVASSHLAIRAAIADNVLEGWRPSPAETANLIAFATGEITDEQYRARALSTCQSDPASSEIECSGTG